MPRSAYSYIRMSTPGQLKGDSLRRQIEASRRYAAEHNLELDESLNLQDLGVSAFKGDNVVQGALSRFLSAIESGVVTAGSTLLVESLDRLSRQRVGAAMGLFLSIVERGVTIVTLADGNEYRPGSSDPMPLIQSLLIMSRAHEESQIKSQRLSAAWEAKRRSIEAKKLTGQCPNWLTLSSDTKSFVVDEKRAAVVHQIYEWALSGMGHFSIAKRLNNEGIPTFGRAKHWGESYVEKILKNPAVMGEFQPHRRVSGKRCPVGEPVEGYFPGIVSADLFYSVQTARRQRRTGAGGRKGPALSNLFGQLARCGHCGATMRMVNKGAPPKGGRYLRCSNALLNAGCHARSWRYEAFEAAFLTFCGEIDTASADAEAEHRALEDRQKVARAADEERLLIALRRRDRAFALLDQTTDDQYVRTKLDECNNEISQIQKRLAKSETKIAVQSVDLPTRDLVAKVSEIKHGDFDLRIKVAKRLKEIVLTLKLYPAGFIPALTHLPFTWGDWLQGRVSEMDIDCCAFLVEFADGTKRFVLSGRDRRGVCIHEITEGYPGGGAKMFWPSGPSLEAALAA